MDGRDLAGAGTLDRGGAYYPVGGGTLDGDLVGGDTLDGDLVGGGGTLDGGGLGGGGNLAGGGTLDRGGDAAGCGTLDGGGLEGGSNPSGDGDLDGGGLTGGGNLAGDGGEDLTVARNPMAVMADAVLHPPEAQSSALVTKAELPAVYEFKRAVALEHALGSAIPVIIVMYKPTGVLMSQSPDAIAAMVHVKPKPPQYLKAPVAATASVAAFAVAVPGGVKAVPATMLAHVDASMYVPLLALLPVHTEGKFAVRLPALQNKGPGDT